MDNNLHLLVPYIDPIEDPFSSEDCLVILMCEREVFVDAVDACLRAGSIEFVSSFYPRFKFYTYWDILCIALTIHFDSHGIDRCCAIRIASLVVDELASEHDTGAELIQVDNSLIDYAFSNFMGEWTKFPEDWYTHAGQLVEIQLLLSSISERCVGIMNRPAELTASCWTSDAFAQAGAMANTLYS